MMVPIEKQHEMQDLGSDLYAKLYNHCNDFKHCKREIYICLPNFLLGTKEDDVFISCHIDGDDDNPFSPHFGGVIIIGYSNHSLAVVENRQKTICSEVELVAKINHWTSSDRYQKYKRFRNFT